MKRFFLYGIFPLSLLVAAGCGKSSKKPATPAENAAEKNKPITVDLFIAQPVPFADTIEVPGTLVASESVDIHPEIAGRIVQLPIEEGKEVKKGSLLAKLNDADLLAQLRKLEVQLQLAEQTEKRQARLLEVQGISQQEYDISLLQVNSLKADIDIVKTSIEKTEIRAPFNGRMGLRNISNGAYVNANSIIATLQQIDPLKLDFSLPEKYIGKIKNGQRVHFRVAGIKDSLSALITATESSLQENSRTLKVRAHVESGNSSLVPGSFAKVNICFSPEPHSILIPTQAILPQARGKKVILFKGGTAVFSEVTTGTRTAEMVLISEGLTIGDTIVTTGLLSVRPGARLSAGKILNPKS